MTELGMIDLAAGKFAVDPNMSGSIFHRQFHNQIFRQFHFAEQIGIGRIAAEIPQETAQGIREVLSGKNLTLAILLHESLRHLIQRHELFPQGFVH